jgi:hypothetical protein
MKTVAIILLCSTAAICTAHAATSRRPVTTIKPLLVTAIDRGEAYGTVTGESRAFMEKHFETSAPIEIDVKALHDLPQAGCKRLQVITRQAQVREASSQAAADKELSYEVSFCRDGQFYAPR